MVTSINLGGFSEQNGRTVVTGSSSGGLDTEGLINALTEARRLPAKRLEDRIEQNSALSGAYSELQTLLTSFQDAANFLRNPPGVGNEDENIFEYRTSTIGGNVSGTASNYLNVTAQPGADISSYDITIDQLATFNTKVTNTFALADANQQAVGATSADGFAFNAGNLELGPNATVVVLEDGDTLNEVVAKINAVSDTSNVRASIIQVSDGNFRLSLKSTVTGSDQNYPLGNETAPNPPAFLASDAIFRLDAQDIDGNGDYTNNPGTDVAGVAPTDASAGGIGTTAVGGGPTLDVDGATNSQATLDFSAGNVAVSVNNDNNINTGGPYQQKAFAFSFTTGADITGTQTIYEQDGAGRSFAVYVAPDAGNGNAPTLFAVVHNTNEWAPGDQFKTLNLGTVTANTDYNVTLNFDASANPGANDPANTFTGFVNGVQVDQATGVREQFAHAGAIGIGYTDGGAALPNGTTFGGTGNYFRGQINEVALFNRTLSGGEIGELQTYFDQKYQTALGGGSSALFNTGFAVVEDAVDAQVTIDGTTINRQTNIIADAIEGLTFTALAQTQPGEELRVNINPDTDLARSAINNFVDSYNEFRIFAARQLETEDDGSPTDDALLASSSTLRAVLGRINAEIATVVDGIANGNFDRLADIGLNFNDFPGDSETPFVRNILTIDEARLDSALAANFNQVRDLFEFDFTTDDPNLTVFRRTNALGTSNIQLNIDQTNGIYEATYTDPTTGLTTLTLDAEALSGGAGVVLRGREGTVLEGLELIYADTGDSIINLGLTQGIGDRIFNSLDEILSDDNGLLTVELDTIADNSSRLQEEIDRIDEIVTRYRETLLRQFSALEQAIANADIILQSLNAQANARLAAS